jgi:hypothetical protein
MRTGDESVACASVHGRRLNGYGRSVRIVAKVPAAVPVVIVLMFFVDFVGGLVGSWTLVIAATVVGSTVIIALARRWGHNLGGELEAARERTGTRPYIEPVWPRWFKLADPKFDGLLMTGLAVGLTVAAVIALVISRL